MIVSPAVLALPRRVATAPGVSRLPRLLRRGSESTWLFALGLGGYLLLAIWMVFGLHYVPADSVSRVANAFYVVGSRDPHLGAIGFVWNPLPSLLDIPMVLLRPVAPWLVTRGFAGSIQTAFFGAASLPVLSAILRRHGVGRGWRLLLVAAYALNPMTAMYSANGMSDVPFMFTLLLAWLLFFRWLERRGARDLAMLGAVMAVSTFIRYEAVVVVAAIAAAILLCSWRRGTPWRRLEAELGVYLLPVVVAVLFWVGANAAIMGDPLHFLHSAYGNLAQQSVTLAGQADVRALESWPAALRFSWLEWYHLYPAFVVAALLVAALAVRRGTLRAVASLVGITVPVLAMQTAMVHSGSSGLWVRYWMSVIPATFVLFAFAIGRVRGVRLRHWVLGVCAVAAVAGDVGSGVAMSDPRIGLEEHEAMQAMLSHHALDATYIDRARGVDLALASLLPARALVLVDSFTANPIVVSADDPTRFVTTSDEDFMASLDDPGAHAVRYFLVPEPVGDGRLDAVNRAYPTMWASGGGAHLIRDFGGPEHWRLYDVSGLGAGTP